VWFCQRWGAVILATSGALVAVTGLGRLALGIAGERIARHDARVERVVERKVAERTLTEDLQHAANSRAAA
jgi:hypothetical protein